jgi:hypothetical protein
MDTRRHKVRNANWIIGRKVCRGSGILEDSLGGKKTQITKALFLDL